jgi:hypothetical protein
MVQINSGFNNMQRQMMDPSQYYANSYATNIMNSDEDFMGMAPITAGSNFNAGIFGGGMMGPNYGCGGQGYGPGSEVMNMSQMEYLQYQEQMENYQIDKKVRQGHKLANAEFSTTAADDAITRQIGVLQRKVKGNEQDSVLSEYNKLVQLVEVKLKEGGYIGANAPKEQVKAHAEKMYFEATGKSVTDDLTENGDSSFVHGLKQGFGGVGWMLTNNKNYEDNISDITGEAKESTASTWQKVGMGTSAIVTGFIGLFALKHGIKALKH